MNLTTETITVQADGVRAQPRVARIKLIEVARDQKRRVEIKLKRRALQEQIEDLMRQRNALLAEYEAIPSGMDHAISLGIKYDTLRNMCKGIES